MARCDCEHEHGEHRRDTGECRECRCNECSCDRCYWPDDDERENPSPAAREDIDVPFSAEEAARMIDVLGTMEQSQLIDQGNHTAPLVRNVWLDLQKWDRQPSGPPRTSRGVEIYPAVFGYGWDLLREALDQLEERVLFSRRAEFQPGSRPPGPDAKRGAEARYKLMKEMSWLASLWRRKLGMARFDVIVRYGRGG